MPPSTNDILLISVLALCGTIGCAAPGRCTVSPALVLQSFNVDWSAASLTAPPGAHVHPEHGNEVSIRCDAKESDSAARASQCIINITCHVFGGGAGNLSKKA